MSAFASRTASSPKQKQTKPELPIAKSSENPGDSPSVIRFKKQCWYLSLACVLEGICCIALIPFINTTSSFLFGFVFTYIGALLRYYLSKWLNGIFSSFFLGTFVCNVLGSIIASAVKLLTKRHSYSLLLTSLLSAQSSGLASALSTMSTYAKETNGLKKKGFGRFVLYAYSTVLFSFALCSVIASL